MGLLGKKELCPVCGGEVRGLLLKRIGGRQSLCKECSEQISMCRDLLKNADPAYVKKHLAYRRKNAEKYNSLRWDVTYHARGTRLGVDPGADCLYLVDGDMDDEANPVVFSFQQITHYELYRLNTKVDDSDTPGEPLLESKLSTLGSIARLVSRKRSSRVDYFRLVLTTTEPYWPELELRIMFNSPDDLYGLNGFAGDLKEMCRVLKHAARREPVSI